MVAAHTRTVRGTDTLRGIVYVRPAKNKNTVVKNLRVVAMQVPATGQRTKNVNISIIFVARPQKRA